MSCMCPIITLILYFITFMDFIIHYFKLVPLQTGKAKTNLIIMLIILILYYYKLTLRAVST